VITCAKCSKENQDHYKFCLGCGSELPKGAPKQFKAEEPPPKVQPKPAAAAPAVAPAPTIAAAPAQADIACPQCTHGNPPGNRFCAACGYKLGGAAPATSVPPQVAPSVSASGVSLTALRADGSEAGHYELPPGSSVTVGRDTGTIFAGDSYLSPRHATFNIKDGKITVRDEGSLNGVYVKLAANEPYHLEKNAVFRIGQEIVRFETLEKQPPIEGVERFGSPAKDIIGRLALVVGRDTTGNAFPIPKRGLHLGRERGDVLFSEDGYVSGLHCQVAPGADDKVYLTDVGSSNGTFVRVRDNHPLISGDILLMGQQVFRLDA
jgi:pSer/pThr/pTyr-binding forkhead associated (FHA) protein